MNLSEVAVDSLVAAFKRSLPQRPGFFDALGSLIEIVFGVMVKGFSELIVELGHVLRAGDNIVPLVNETASCLEEHTSAELSRVAWQQVAVIRDVAETSDVSIDVEGGLRGTLDGESSERKHFSIKN